MVSTRRTVQNVAHEPSQSNHASSVPPATSPGRDAPGSNTHSPSLPPALVDQPSHLPNSNRSRRSRVGTQYTQYAADAENAAAARKRKRKDSEAKARKRRAALTEQTNADIQARISQLEGELKKANGKAKKYKHMARKVQDNQQQTEPPLVPKPKGRVQIQSDMQLDDHEYDSIRDGVITTLKHSGVDIMVSWTRQPVKKQADIVEVARSRDPRLKRYAGDWATIAIASQYLDNHIGYVRRKSNPDSNFSKKRAEKMIGRRGNHAKHREVEAHETDEEQHEQEAESSAMAIRRASKRHVLPPSSSEEESSTSESGSNSQEEDDEDDDGDSTEGVSS